MEAFSATPSDAQIRSVARRLLRGRTWFCLFFGLIIVGYAGLLAASGNVGIALIIGVLGPLFAVGVPPLAVLRATRRMRPQLARPRTYRFNEDGMRSTVESADSLVRWSAVDTLDELRPDVLLLRAQRVPMPVFTDQLSPEARTELIAFIRAHLSAESPATIPPPETADGPHFTFSAAPSPAQISAGVRRILRVRLLLFVAFGLLVLAYGLVAAAKAGPAVAAFFLVVGPLIAVVVPVLALWRATAGVRPQFAHPRTYRFDADGVRITEPNSAGLIRWAALDKLEVPSADLLVLRVNKRVRLLIFTDQLTPDIRADLVAFVRTHTA
ncbi:mono/diheme cytochrome c family protein [Actinoplanes tereljensis]|uniref:YcxB-like protein domain-containing protein n=1 Tax=Paractinoplanes tereljensis TaxID=571912 RepID=A0A919NG49_9ACTN|nr:hypothetical protein [Actinoplanes tereljensis]GIF17843.1 hypothetical protein Ate02nite_05730 [Actinoplanes tereljensis]